MIQWLPGTVSVIFVARIISTLLGNGLVVSEGKLHAMHKRLMMPSFNTHSVASRYSVSVLCYLQLDLIHARCFMDVF